MNKNDYIKQLKRLIKKYHPDLHDNSYMESMYSEITKILVNKLNEVKLNKNEINIKKHNKNKEMDYFYYKSGIRFYKNIHPDKFYKRNPDSTYETKTYNDFIKILNGIYLSFNTAQYYFNKVINDCPQSPYYEDSVLKIKLLKKLYKSYENTIFEENKVINNEKFISEMGLKIL